MTVDEALGYVDEFCDESRHRVIVTLALEVHQLRWQSGVGGNQLRSGRPEDLTLDSAEKHATWLSERPPDDVTIVGRLMIVMHDEVRRLRSQETELTRLRIAVMALVDKWRALAEGPVKSDEDYYVADMAGDAADQLEWALKSKREL